MLSSPKKLRKPQGRRGLAFFFAFRLGLPVLPGRVDHGQDARTERFRQRRPGAENAMQVRVFFDFTGQGMGQGDFMGCRNVFSPLAFTRNGQGVRVPLGVLGYNS